MIFDEKDAFEELCACYNEIIARKDSSSLPNSVVFINYASAATRCMAQFVKYAVPIDQMSAFLDPEEAKQDWLLALEAEWDAAANESIGISS